VKERDNKKKMWVVCNRNTNICPINAKKERREKDAR
jgi:hypothetical protein